MFHALFRFQFRSGSSIEDFILRKPSARRSFGHAEELYSTICGLAVGPDLKLSATHSLLLSRSPILCNRPPSPIEIYPILKLTPNTQAIWICFLRRNTCMEMSINAGEHDTGLSTSYVILTEFV